MKLKGQMGELVREFKPGYWIKPSGDHVKVMGPDGKVVRIPGKGQPLTLAVTAKTNGTHYIKRIRSNLVEAGVIAANERDRIDALLQERAARKKLEPPPVVVPEFAVFTPPPPKPEIVLNLSWEEFEALEEVAQFVVASKGPRAIKKCEPFLRAANRAHAVMERRLAT